MFDVSCILYLLVESKKNHLVFGEDEDGNVVIAEHESQVSVSVEMTDAEYCVLIDGDYDIMYLYFII